MVEILSLTATILGLVVLPLVIIAFRAAIRWKGIEDRLNMVITDLADIVKDKDKIHAEMILQMREDRKATDRRLRWLEENIWRVHNIGNST